MMRIRLRYSHFWFDIPSVIDRFNSANAVNCAWPITMSWRSFSLTHFYLIIIIIMITLIFIYFIRSILFYFIENTRPIWSKISCQVILPSNGILTGYKHKQFWDINRRPFLYTYYMYVLTFSHFHNFMIQKKKINIRDRLESVWTMKHSFSITKKIRLNWNIDNLNEYIQFNSIQFIFMRICVLSENVQK